MRIKIKTNNKNTNSSNNNNNYNINIKYFIHLKIIFLMNKTIINYQQKMENLLKNKINA